MATIGEYGRPAAQSLPEALARTLRHEVGDLLQTIYAAVAILQKRLPAEATLERQLLADLRGRAVACKRLLDNVSDLVSPVSLSIEQVEPAQLAEVLVATVAPRYPKLEVRADASERVCLPADEKRLSQVGEMLLAEACEAALSRVCFQTRPDHDGGGVEWIVMDDRPAVEAEAQEDFFSPFTMAGPAKSGIRLALAKRLVQLHGGRITAASMPEGGFCVRAWLPVKAPASNRERGSKAPNE
jgi:signal transduction histidine kinase